MTWNDLESLRITYNGIWEGLTGDVSQKSLKTPIKKKGDRPTDQLTKLQTDKLTDRQSDV